MFFKSQNYNFLSKIGLVFGLLILLFGFSVATVGAGSWSIASQGDCASGYPKGASWLNWSGYNFWDSGHTAGGLYHWSGSSWDLISSGGGDDSGSSGLAIGNYSASYQSGSWTTTGGHTASFFSGQQNSLGNNFNC